MSPIEKLRTQLINRILVTNNEQLLQAINGIFSSTSVSETYDLDPFQENMLTLSRVDIEEGNIVSESDLAERDKEWMN